MKTGYKGEKYVARLMFTKRSFWVRI